MVDKRFERRRWSDRHPNPMVLFVVTMIFMLGLAWGHEHRSCVRNKAVREAYNRVLREFPIVHEPQLHDLSCNKLLPDSR